MKPNRTKKPLQLDRLTLRVLETSDLASIMAGVRTCFEGSKPISVCTTITYC